MASSKYGHKRLTIKALNVYPIKSCRGITLQSATLTPQGLLYDRKWMFVDSSKADSNRFMTIRERSELTLINTAIDDTNQILVVTFPDTRQDKTTTPDDVKKRQIRVPLSPTDDYLRTQCKKVEVNIWHSPTDAYTYTSPDVTDPIDQFFGSCGSADEQANWTPGNVNLVMKGPTARIAAGNGAPDQLGRTEHVNFPDLLPVLVATEESLQELNSRIEGKGEKAITIEHFRPNVVVSSHAPSASSSSTSTLTSSNETSKTHEPTNKDQSNTLEPWEEDRWTLLRFNPPPSLSAATTSPPITITTTPSSPPSAKPPTTTTSTSVTPTTTSNTITTTLLTLLATLLSLLNIPWLIPHLFPSSSPFSTFPPIDTDVSARCARCHVPNVDPSTGVKHDTEPWKTLYAYRRVDPGFKYKPYFGMLCCPRSKGAVAVGGEVEVRGVMAEGKEHVYIKGF